MQKLNLKKLFLYLLIASVSISALLGIFTILLGNFGELEIKVLLTTLLISVISILGLACGASIEAKRGKFLPYAGIAFSLIAGICWVILIWIKFDTTSDLFPRIVMSSTVFAAAFSHLSLISLARLDRKFRWAIYSLFAGVFALVSLFMGFIWITDFFDNEFSYRILGVLTIIVSALTITIPVLHKLSDNFDETERIDAEIEKLKTRISELEMRKEKISNNK